jgi:serine/threonine-protein kinase
MSGRPSAPDDITAPSGEVRTDEPIPREIGRYAVLGELGRGGMGRVLRAYDPKLQREVALKTVRKGQVSGAAQARMIREARAMAKLSHSNVVAVFDVEVDDDGGVVLAMELVAGTTISQWLLGNPTWTEILDAFVAAGHGLAAAHAAGLLHRDFKPSNVLVGDDGRVKVTDFGLAKPAGSAPSQDASLSGDDEDPDLTSPGSVVGTPRYMAPEQYTGSELDETTDQYAFCIALWQALCGEPPFEGNMRQLREAKALGPPPWPRESTVPRSIADAIARGLAPARHLRWPSMDALLAALAHDPFRRRRRVAWVVGVAVVGSGIAAAGWTWQAQRASLCSGAAVELQGVWDDDRRAEVEAAFGATAIAYAPATWSLVRDAVDAYAQQWSAQHREACEATTMRGEQSQAVMDARMACLRRARVDLAAAVDVLAHADADVVEEARRVVDQLPPLSRCEDAEALLAEVSLPESGEQTEAVEAARLELARTRALMSAGKYDDALAIAEPLLHRSEAIGHAPLHTEVLLTIGRVRRSKGEFPAAEAHLREAYRSALMARQWSTAEICAEELAWVVGYAQERPAEAQAYLDTARGLLPRVGPEGSVEHSIREARIESHAGQLEIRAGKYAEAQQRLQRVVDRLVEVLGPDHPDVITTRGTLAQALDSLGKPDEAEAEYRIVVAMKEQRLGAQHPSTGLARLNLAVTLFTQHRLEEAEREYVAAREVLETALGPDHPQVAFARGNLAHVYELQERFAEAEAEHRATLAIKIKAFGADHPRVSTTRSGLATSLSSQGKFEEAEKEAREALRVIEQAQGPDHPDVAKLRCNVAYVLQQMKRYPEAVAELRRAKKVIEAQLGPDHPDVATVAHYLGTALLHVEGGVEEGIAELERAWALRKRVTVSALERGEAAFSLAEALQDRDRARARELAAEAMAAYGDAGDAGKGPTAAIQRWLARHS